MELDRNAKFKNELIGLENVFLSSDILKKKYNFFFVGVRLESPM